VELSWSSKALVATLLFRMLFGGYLMGMDQYSFNDVGSALTVLVIYGLIGVFATLFLLGKRFGLIAIIALDAVFIVLQSVFTIASLCQITDPGLHNPIANWWATLLMFMFSILTIVLAIKTKSDTKPQHAFHCNLRSD
jgi:hypothetical protein